MTKKQKYYHQAASHLAQAAGLIADAEGDGPVTSEQRVVVKVILEIAEHATAQSHK